jgi:hypothetical protein
MGDMETAGVGSLSRGRAKAWHIERCGNRYDWPGIQMQVTSQGCSNAGHIDQGVKNIFQHKYKERD